MTQTRLSRSRKTLTPLGTITTAHARAEGLCGLSKLTQLTRVHLEQALSGLTNLSTSQSTYANHRVILLSTWVYELLEMSTICLGMLLELQRLGMAGWGCIYSPQHKTSHWRKAMLSAAHRTVQWCTGQCIVHCPVRLAIGMTPQATVSAQDFYT